MDGPETITIIFKGARRTVAYAEGETILQTARRSGLNPPFSCEAGDCATCIAFLEAGSVTMRANEALEPDEVADGFILTCQSVPDSAGPGDGPNTDGPNTDGPGDGVIVNYDNL